MKVARKHDEDELDTLRKRVLELQNQLHQANATTVNAAAAGTTTMTSNSAAASATASNSQPAADSASIANAAYASTTVERNVVDKRTRSKAKRK